MYDYDGTPVSAAEEVAQIEMERPHVVLLGAGASRAAFPNGDANWHKLPLMADFIDIVPIRRLLDQVGFDYKNRNFEDIYAALHNTPHLISVCEELESIVYNYFSALSLPNIPTLYDHLVLSLRKKDFIVTFNWDPFLIQAIRRNKKVLQDEAPIPLFLHGNVEFGYCQPNDIHRDFVHGVRGFSCDLCGMPLKESKLLYPISNKNYDQDAGIIDAWKRVKRAFESAFMITIFGYGGPQSDFAAIELLNNAWGGGENRRMEEIEIVDVRSKHDLLKSWEIFIHTHHYDITSDAYTSWMFTHPRRTGEAYLNNIIKGYFIEDNCLPRNASFPELWNWFKPLLDVERNQI